MEKAGTRHTRQKQAIMDFLMSVETHPTADEIFNQIRRDLPRISLATVYRNLNTMVTEGKVIELHTSRNLSRYDANTRGHAHFICDNCEVILDLPLPFIETDTLTREGHRIHDTRLNLHGICRDCLSSTS